MSNSYVVLLFAVLVLAAVCVTILTVAIFAVVGQFWGWVYVASLLGLFVCQFAIKKDEDARR